MGYPAWKAFRLFRLPDPRDATTLPRSVKAALPPIRGRLEQIRERIARAASRSGRDPGSVSLVAVTKGVPPEIVKEALAAGLGDFAENRVQEAERKIEVLGREVARWHMVGQLQRNKANRAAALFDRIHSVDRADLADALARRKGERAGLRTLVQVNVGGNPAQGGIDPHLLEPLLEHVISLPGLVCDGLMCIAPIGRRSDEARAAFVRTRELRDASERALGVALPELSMGMSGDYEAAVEEGSTMVRIGTALFGERG